MLGPCACSRRRKHSTSTLIIKEWSKAFLMLQKYLHPKEFCHLRSLKYLDLKYYSRMILLPDSFVKLTKLEHIDLSKCFHLQTLRYSFGNLTNLHHNRVSTSGNYSPNLMFLYFFMSRYFHPTIRIISIVDQVRCTVPHVSSLSIQELELPSQNVFSKSLKFAHSSPPLLLVCLCIC